MMPGQVSDFWGFEPPIHAVVPATLPLSYALKLKKFGPESDIQVSYPFSDVEAPDRARRGGGTAHFNPEVHSNLSGILVTLSNAWS
jgi:hypothetical protein